VLHIARKEVDRQTYKEAQDDGSVISEENT
jgi:hypothetical protein